MAIPSVRLLTAAVLAALEAHAHLTVYASMAGDEYGPDGTVSKPGPRADEHGRLAQGYAVLHPSAGDAGTGTLAATPGQLVWGFQVDAVGGDHDQIGWVIDTVRGLLDGKTLTVAGARVGLLQPPLGYQPPPPRPLFQATPPRLMVPLQYRVLTVGN